MSSLECLFNDTGNSSDYTALGYMIMHSLSSKY